MTYRLGVDLGTTFSAAAVERGGSIDVVTLGARAGAIPSALYLREDGELSFGEAAVLAGATDPLRFIGSVKRRIGDTEPVVLGGEPHEPIALLAALLRHVVGAAAEREGGPPEHVVVARPANWGPVKLAALEEVMAQAGLGARSSVTEPHAAAAFTFGQRVTAGQVVAVYDLGGGTFDAAVLGRTPTGFELLGRPEGVEHLGGLDFDEAVLFHVRRTLGDQWPRSTSGALSLELAMHRLRQECVAAKEALSFVEETAVPVVLPGVYTSVPITRAEFEDMIRPTLVESLGAFRRALAAAGVGPDDLTAVLLAGGSSQIPLVGELVREVAPNAATLGADAKYAVCRGAALLAEPGAPSDPPPPPPAHAQTAPVA
ncbi:MAG: Hsp70 family protein, partial [Acidimicrobiales bacterium]